MHLFDRVIEKRLKPFILNSAFLGTTLLSMSSTAAETCNSLFIESFPAFNVAIVEDRVHINGVYNSYQSAWQGLSKTKEDLADFRNNQFQILVHAGSSPRKIDRLLADPELLAKALTFSSSLLDQNHTRTYGEYGVILAVPPENILATSSVDMGTPFAREYKAEALEAIRAENFFYDHLLRRNSVKTPIEVLKATPPNKWNEILVAGTTPHGGSVKVIGLFLKTKGGQIQSPEDVVLKLQELGQRLKLQIIFIEHNDG